MIRACQRNRNLFSGSRPYSRWFAHPAIAIAIFIGISCTASGYDLHFDYTSFDNPNTAGANPHFGQAQFDVLNYPSINGSYMMTSRDNHRPEMVTNNNDLAQFYNNFLADYNTQYNSTTGLDPVAEADAINAYTVRLSTTTGPRPTWLILNELSASVWPDTTQKGINYRNWVISTVTRLHDTYGYSVVTYAPFSNPGNFSSDWQTLAAKSYIGIENYLSGAEVMAGGSNYASRVAWAQSQYQSSKTSYNALGVSSSRLLLGEDFANNVSGTAWGRSGLSIADWDTVIQIRQDAIYNANFVGFLAYGWGGNNLGITEPEQIEAEYYYRSRRVLQSQKPQWLSDNAINLNGSTVPLSWSQALNWLGGVPNATGAEANFWRTLTANRTITLDGNKTIGKLLFDSPFSYIISPGTGGTLNLNNSASAAMLTSNQGNHTVSTAVTLTNGLIATISSGVMTFTGSLSGTGMLTKSGLGTMFVSGSTSYSGNTSVIAGMLSFSNRGLADAADVFISSGGALDLKFTGTADIIDSLFLNGISQPVGTWGAIGSGAQFTTSALSGTGWLQVTTYVPSLLTGDYNCNGVVDIADYNVWRRSVGATTIANRDSLNTGTIGIADYDSWRSRFGQIAGFGLAAGLVDIGSVPEPSNKWMLVVVLLFFNCAVARHRGLVINSSTFLHALLSKTKSRHYA